jgi:translation initiation factor 3 subunit C
MPLDAWAAARTNLDDLLQTLATETRYVVRENAPDYDDLDERAPDPEDPKSILIVRGSIISLIDRLDDEFTKSLQNLDPHTGEYIDRLKEEKLIYQTIVKGMNYYEMIGVVGLKAGERDHLDRVVMRRLEHIYCKVSYNRGRSWRCCSED